ncbi:MAG: restriction endonuclease [Candidatus Moraniibacteriota bacterium]|nr:MAG: restriction endonuclease [Candidatus Moranbacteria bacterium]
MRQNTPKYKPLLFTTTMRNPKRLKGILNVFKYFDGEQLTNELATSIMGELIRYGLYRPTKGITKSIEQKWGSKRITDTSQIGVELLSDKDVTHLLEKNPQRHKEAGFEAGWPSRFATVFDLAKELGFVYYKQGENIQFSEIGNLLAESIEITTEDGLIGLNDVHPEFEQHAFLNALAKYQRKNPFVRVLNDNVPLILLLEVIQKLKDDPELSDAGISKLELPFVAFWKNNDSNALYRFIKAFRERHGLNPSFEVIVDVCVDDIMEGDYKKFKPSSLTSDYVDEFIRKMRLTGIFSLRGAGRFLDINQKEIDKVRYILATYSDYSEYTNEREYFKYVSTIDDNLVSVTLTTAEEQSVYLEKWVNTFSWDEIRKEMMILAQKQMSKNDILKYIAAPVRLEFLASIAIKSKFPDIRVSPNYPVDDEGLPTSTAAGTNNTGDIECFENQNGVLVEVTMSEGRIQTMMEVWPISRHLEAFKPKVESAMCYFVAPSIFSDSARQIDYVKKTENLFIIPKTIEDFLEHLENNSVLYSMQ